MNSPLITMSAITGKPSQNDIYEYLNKLKEHGVAEVMLYPRSGCEIEYLSDAWFSAIGNFINAAVELNMRIWLYDDFNWPSGDAGGRVTSNPNYRLRAISTVGDTIGQITVKSQHNSGLFGEKYFPDLLSPDAVSSFIEYTHEEYYKRFGKHFGSVIRGIFTDEPSVGYCCHNGCIPYYDGIENDYRMRFFGDFYTDMREKGDFYVNAITLISERFKSNYIDRLASWCRSHGILMTGHLMNDNNPFYGVGHSGNTVKNLSAFSLPGIDEISTCFDDACEMALFGVAEYASGDNGAMAELFALGPCDMSYEKKRCMLFLAACHKIDNYFLAISHLDMRGNLLVKDFFNNFSADQPDFVYMKDLAREAANAAELAKKDYIPDVYIRYPFLVAADRINKETDTTVFFNLINELTYKQIQWKFTDNESEGDAPVIELTRDLKLSVDKKPFNMSLIKGKVTVTDEKGDTPRGIFVRRFTDGAYTVLNLFSYEGNYLIDGKNVYLKKHGVYFSEAQNTNKEFAEISPEFNITYKNKSVIRTMHLSSDSVTEIHCKSNTWARFFVRKGTKAFINGEEIIAENERASLPRGMRNLYYQTEKRKLTKGIYKVTATDDFKYMPTLLISGAFEAEFIAGDTCKIILKDRRKTYTAGDRIYGYGTIEFNTEINIPKNMAEIEITGAELYTQAEINDTPLEKKKLSSYQFIVPAKLRNQNAKLKITQYSSLAPIFADVDFWDKAVKECGWRGTPSPSNKPFGFLNLLLKEAGFNDTELVVKTPDTDFEILF